MATKNYNVGPQDGWVKIMDTGKSYSTRISAFPHTSPFYVFGDPSATPSLITDKGVQVCHTAFQTENSTADGNKDAFWVRVVNPSAGLPNGRIRIDLYTDGGTPH